MYDVSIPPIRERLGIVAAIETSYVIGNRKKWEFAIGSSDVSDSDDVALSDIFGAKTGQNWPEMA